MVPTAVPVAAAGARDGTATATAATTDGPVTATAAQVLPGGWGSGAGGAGSKQSRQIAPEIGHPAAGAADVADELIVTCLAGKGKPAKQIVPRSVSAAAVAATPQQSLLQVKCCLS